jgi:hypothetical protein
MGSIATTDSLFEAVRLGALQLKHRVVLAPCTRMRASKESDGVYVPNNLNVEYYSQRASEGGFMLTEATPISRLVSIRSDSKNPSRTNNRRLPDIQEFQGFSPHPKLRAGRKSQMRCTLRAALSTASCGMLVERLSRPFSTGTRFWVPVISQLAETHWMALNTRPLRPGL